MSVNMVCYKKSVISDFKSLGMYCLFIISVIIGGVIGYKYYSDILNIFREISIPPFVISTFISLIVLAFILYDVAFDTKKEVAKEKNYYLNGICIVELFLVMVDFLGILVCAIIAAALKITPEFYMYDFIISLIIISIANIVSLPFAIAYARCKDEPYETGTVSI